MEVDGVEGGFHGRPISRHWTPGRWGAEDVGVAVELEPDEGGVAGGVQQERDER